MLTRICTCYRQWHYFRRWIQNEALFEDPDIEWMILNDCPTDPIPSDLATVAAQHRIHVHEFPVNVGRAQARNWGAKQAATRWIEFIDGDDIPLPLSAKMLKGYETQDYLVFENQFHTINHTNEVVPFVMDMSPTSEYVVTRNHYGFLFKEYQPFESRPAATLWQRDPFLALLGYDPRMEPVEDVHLIWKAKLSKYKMDHVPQPKQSYQLWNDLEPKSSPIDAAGKLRFWHYVKQSCPDPELYKTIDERINWIHQCLWWEAKTTYHFPSKFRFKESIKWLI